MLEGYRHQVGGQFQLMKYGESVCKPLVLRENIFYESLSEELKTFTAVYHGELCVYMYVARRYSACLCRNYTFVMLIIYSHNLR